MAYPSRGAWRFVNHTRSFDYWPTLESVNISQDYPDMTATYNATVVDMGEGYEFQPEDEVRVFFRGDRIFAGHLKAVTQEQVDETGPRQWTLEAQDYTAKLSDALIRRRKKRKREKALRRVRWILGYMRSNIWSLSSRDLSHIPDTYVGAYDYFGNSVEEALAQVADELGMYFWVDLDNKFQMVKQDPIDPPFVLDNDNPNYTTRFPFREYHRTKDTVELANAILTEPEKRKHSRWVKNASSISTYGRQERFQSDSNLHRPQQAIATGNRTLEDTKDPEVEGGCVVFEPGIWAGMKVRVIEDLWNHDEYFFITNVSIAAVDPHENGKAYLFSTLTFGDRRRKRRRSGHPRHRDKSINKNSKRRPGDTDDGDPRPVDKFDREVSPPFWLTGEFVTGANSPDGYTVRTRFYRYGQYVPFPGPNLDIQSGPISEVWSAAGAVRSLIGADNTPWTAKPPDVGCDGLAFWFAGWEDREAWWSFDVPAHPADMAGITLDVSLPAGKGVAPQYGAQVVVSSSLPSTTWQGAAVGAAVNGSTVFIPASLVPAEGGRIYIGIRANWACDYYETFCGWNFPLATGYGNSGQFDYAQIGNVHWAVWSDTGGDMGAIDEPADAPWEGGNEWRHEGTEGSPEYGVDGEAYYVQSTGLGGHGIYLVGEREDDDEPWGPWSDTAWAVEFVFEVDANGDPFSPGPRHIQVTTVGEGEKTVGTVHLGDSANAEGISVAAPTNEDYTAKAIGVNEKWVAKFDSRSNRMRGKLWRMSDGEPARWDVDVAMSETEDDGDRFTIWVRCGNATQQTVRIHRILAHAGAHDGTRIVREWLGFADGHHNLFQTNHPFREGTIRAFVNGVGVAPHTEHGDLGEFVLDAAPTEHSAMRATYIVDVGG